MVENGWANGFGMVTLSGEKCASNEITWLRDETLIVGTGYNYDSEEFAVILIVYSFCSCWWRILSKIRQMQI